MAMATTTKSKKHAGVYTNDAVSPHRVMFDVPLDIERRDAPHPRKAKALAMRLAADLEELAIATKQIFTIEPKFDDFVDANGTWWTGIRIVIELVQAGMEAVDERKAAISICNQVRNRTWLISAIAEFNG